MSIHRLKRQVWIPQHREVVFDFFSKASNLERITPPMLSFHILTPEPIQMQPGTLIDYSLRVHGVPLRWRTEITIWDPPHQFADIQLKGPYKMWHHTHTFEETQGGTLMTDDVHYALPFGPLGDLVHKLMVRKDVESIFSYRTKQMEEQFGPVREFAA